MSKFPVLEVVLNDETEIKWAESEEQAEFKDIRRGIPLAVFGQFGQDGRALVARLIVILPLKDAGP